MLVVRSGELPSSGHLASVLAAATPKVRLGVRCAQEVVDGKHLRYGCRGWSPSTGTMSSVKRLGAAAARAVCVEKVGLFAKTALSCVKMRSLRSGGDSRAQTGDDRVGVVEWDGVGKGEERREDVEVAGETSTEERERASGGDWPGCFSLDLLNNRCD